MGIIFEKVKAFQMYGGDGEINIVGGAWRLTCRIWYQLYNYFIYLIEYYQLLFIKNILK